MNKVAVYPGSFDPISNGHIDIIRRTDYLFDKLIVAVLNNPNKKYWFTLEERVNMIKKTIPKNSKIEVIGFEGLLVNFMHEKNASIVVRGLRALSDYEYELQLALTNDMLAEVELETVFLPASRENLYLSSSVVKEIALYGGNLKEFVNEILIEEIQKKAKQIKEGQSW